MMKAKEGYWGISPVGLALVEAKVGRPQLVNFPSCLAAEMEIGKVWTGEFHQLARVQKSENSDW